jgi:hypothetical protein
VSTGGAGAIELEVGSPVFLVQPQTFLVTVCIVAVTVTMTV